MQKIFFIIPITLIVVFLMVVLSESPNQDEDFFHIILANSNSYENGIFSKTVFFTQGNYIFKFVPNGSSPENITIRLIGENHISNYEFLLKGNLQETGISEYFTWEYLGEKEIQIDYDQNLQIEIDPNGQTDGSVSVYIMEN
jgi:hypothetical protein